MATDPPPAAADDLDAAPVVRALGALFDEARRLAATDVYMTPGPDGLAVQYRVAGSLVAGAVLPRPLSAAFAGRLKGLAAMNIAERRRPQHGELHLIDGGPLTAAVVSLPTRRGEAFHLAVRPRERIAPPPDAPLLSASCDARIRSFFREGRGLLLVSGGTSDLEAGLAATAALAAPLGLHAHLLSAGGDVGAGALAETTVAAVGGLPLATAVRAAAEHRFDALFLPILRSGDDLVEAMVACSGARCVVAGWRARTPEAVPFRVQLLGLYPRIVRQRLFGVLRVRSVRSLCAACSQRGRPDAEQLRRAAQHPGLRVPPKVWSPGGCSACSGTGFSGQQLAAELLELPTAAYDLSAPGACAAGLRAAAFPAGRGTLAEELSIRLETGQVSLGETLEALRA